MGFPMYPHLQDMAGFDLQLPNASDSMLGNGMHVPSIGVILMISLACVRSLASLAVRWWLQLSATNVA